MTMIDNKKADIPTIKCPHCGADYLPAEIFYPDDFAGRPTNVIKDALGKVLYHDYEEGCEALATESYICDQCLRSFIVEPVVSFKVKKTEEALDFAKTTASLID